MFTNRIYKRDLLVKSFYILTHLCQNPLSKTHIINILDLLHLYRIFIHRYPLHPKIQVH